LSQNKAVIKNRFRRHTTPVVVSSVAITTREYHARQITAAARQLANNAPLNAQLRVRRLRGASR